MIGWVLLIGAAAVVMVIAAGSETSPESPDFRDGLEALGRVVEHSRRSSP